MICCFLQVLPQWMIANPNVIATGSDVADSIITVLLSTSILVGGVIGCVLDNIIPGDMGFYYLGFVVVIQKGSKRARSPY